MMQRHTDNRCQGKFMKLVITFSAVLLTTLLSCKKSSVGPICFSRMSTGLKIENHTDKEFYFVAFGQNILPVIDWFPNCGNNGIAANSEVNKDLSSITGYLDNDEVVVFWWECNGNNPGEIQQVVLDKEQTVCK